MRCMHEASCHEQNCFITLTYEDEKLPKDLSLNKRHWQLFMKKLRKNENGKKIRYYHCGEYGEETQRPHYHALIFGHDFEDKRFYKRTQRNEILYTSETLERVWGLGFCPIGSISFESAAYVARYQLKKRTGPGARQHYQGREPEYATMSRGGTGGLGGIGQTWLNKWAHDVYPHDYVVVNGKKVKPPKFYDSKLPEDWLEEIKQIRKERELEHEWNNTDERLAVREFIQSEKQKNVRRQL